MDVHNIQDKNIFNIKDVYFLLKMTKVLWKKTGGDHRDANSEGTGTRAWKPLGSAYRDVDVTWCFWASVFFFWVVLEVKNP